MMKKTALLLIIILVGCATTEIDAVDPWVGASTDKLRTTWGTPLKIEDDGIGGQILTYEVGTFYVDSSGTIYRTETNYSRTPIEEKWVGKNVKELIAEMGPPSHISSDENGGQVLVYIYPAKRTIISTRPSRPYDNPGFYTRNGRYVQPPPKTPVYESKSVDTTVTKLFYVNKSGIIYRVGH